MERTFKNPVLNFLFAIRFYVYSFLNFVLLYFLNLYYKKTDTFLFIVQNHGIGDHLVLTSILSDWAKSRKIIVISMKPRIYNNLKIKNIGLKQGVVNREIISFLGNSRHSNIIGYSNGNLLYKSSTPHLKKHKIYLREALIYGRQDIIKAIETIPHNVKIVFSQEEIELFKHKYEDLFSKPYAIIMSGAKDNNLQATEILPIEKLQEIVNKTKNKINWTHLGVREDKSLKGVIDLRGETSLRETFYIISKSKLIFCKWGMFTYLSTAFNIPCVVSHGSRTPAIESYENVVPLIASPLPPCAYCFENPCPKYKKPKCIENIKTGEAVNLLKKTWDKSLKSRS